MHYKLTCTLLQASPAEGSTVTRHSNAYLIGNTHPEVASHLSVGVSPVKTIGESSGNTMVNMPIIRYAFLSVIALGALSACMPNKGNDPAAPGPGSPSESPSTTSTTTNPQVTKPDIVAPFYDITLPDDWSGARLLFDSYEYALGDGPASGPTYGQSTSVFLAGEDVAAFFVTATHPPEGRDFQALPQSDFDNTRIGTASDCGATWDIILSRAAARYSDSRSYERGLDEIARFINVHTAANLGDMTDGNLVNFLSSASGYTWGHANHPDEARDRLARILASGTYQASDPLSGIPSIDSWQPYRDGGSSYASEDDVHRAGVSLALAVPTEDASGSAPVSGEALLNQTIPYDPWEEAPSLHLEWAKGARREGPTSGPRKKPYLRPPRGSASSEAAAGATLSGRSSSAGPGASGPAPSASSPARARASHCSRVTRCRCSTPLKNARTWPRLTGR